MLLQPGFLIDLVSLVVLRVILLIILILFPYQPRDKQKKTLTNQLPMHLQHRQECQLLY
jgi:hypothetical protein